MKNLVNLHYLSECNFIEAIVDEWVCFLILIRRMKILFAQGFLFFL